MKRKVALSVLLLLGGCATAQSKVEPCNSWGAIFHAPNDYNGQEVVLHGWFSAEFEVCALRSRDGKHELWVAPSDAEPALCTLEQAVLRPVHGWAKVKGVFNYGASYGHLGTYSAAIANAQIVFASSNADSGCLPDAKADGVGNPPMAHSGPVTKHGSAVRER